MKRKLRKDSENERREFDFDFSKAEWGKYHRRKREEGSNIVMIEPDVAKRFRSSAAVNDALRLLLEASKLAEKPKRKTHGRTVKTGVAAKKA